MAWSLRIKPLNCSFFFFQAEDGIRDYKVTGVQTCALPISAEPLAFAEMNEQAAAHVRRLGHWHEIAQAHAILGVEAFSGRIAGDACHIVEEVLAPLDQ